MKRLFSLFLVALLAACGTAVVPEGAAEESSEDGASLGVVQSALSGCMACPQGYRATRYYCSGDTSKCGSCYGWGNAVECAPNTNFFLACNLSCPLGWHVTEYRHNPDCGTSGTNNQVACARDTSDFKQCGTSCPLDYDESGYDTLTKCAPIDGPLLYSNAVTCRLKGVGGEEPRHIRGKLTLPPVIVADSYPAGYGSVELDQFLDVPMQVYLSSDSPIVFMSEWEWVSIGGPWLKHATFPISARPITQPTKVRITANFETHLQIEELTVIPQPQVQSIRLSSQIVTGSMSSKDSVELTVTLDAPAPSAGMWVQLRSSNYYVVSVSHLLMPGGSTTASTRVGASIVSTPTSVTLSATTGGVTRSTSLTVNPPPPTEPRPISSSGAVITDPGCRARSVFSIGSDWSEMLELPFALKFFGTTYTYLYINENGNVTFEDEPDYTSDRLSAKSPPIIAPFLADIYQITPAPHGGLIWYGNTLFGNRPAVCIHWDDVAYDKYEWFNIDKRNDIQLLLVNRSDVSPGDFDIVMNYDRVEWDSGRYQGGEDGLGGLSAVAGYSAGTGLATDYLELPGSRVNGAFLDTNTETGLAKTSRNSLQPGRHIFEVRNGKAPVGGTLSGRVTDSAASANALADAPVQVCPVAGGRCLFITRTGAGGRYTASGLPEGDYLVTAFPPADSYLTRRTVGPVHLPASGHLEVDVALGSSSPLPPGTRLLPSRTQPVGIPSVNNQASVGIPSVNSLDRLYLSAPGCAGGMATYQLSSNAGEVIAGPMQEAPTGQYAVSIDPLSPVTGPARVTVSVLCPNGLSEASSFDIHIESSALVHTRMGRPIPGALVSLYRADSPTGPFELVPAGSAIMSPSKRTNPYLTDDQGRYGWDVTGGYYVVRAKREGCRSLWGAPYTESGVLSAPLSVTEMDLVLDCPELDERQPPTSTLTFSQEPDAEGRYHGPVTVRITASDEGSGVQNIIYRLSGAQAGGGSVAGGEAEVTLTAEGVTTLNWFARDALGNEELSRAVQVRIDTSVPSGWELTGGMALDRLSHTATLLPNGKVLVAGGHNTTSELYDPASRTWVRTGDTVSTRRNHTLTQLNDGRVLMAGGQSSAKGASAELYDPARGTWSVTGSMREARRDHTATLLPDGRVLVAGGRTGGPALRSAELYDPASGTWSVTGSMREARRDHTATLLPDGRVLVAGGRASGPALRSAEVYDPASGTWAAVGGLGVGRYLHTATALSGGKVLVVGNGGSDMGPAASAEVYDPASGTWSTTSNMAAPRRYHTATLLRSGKVLVAGGYHESSGILTSAEVYDPASGNWSATAQMHADRYSHTATLLPDGRVLAVGGASHVNQASAELYTEGR